jgi:hypothetical protein
VNSPFVDAYTQILRQSDHYRLSAIVEMACLTSAQREKLTSFYKGRCWPLLYQAQFHNLQAVGPWLFGARPGSAVAGQYDFQWQLEQGAPGAVSGWIISALPPEKLAQHLGQANVVFGVDGHSYMLRYHTAAALQVLSARRELPGVSEWLAPIHHWWAALAHPKLKLWQPITGANKPQITHVPPITLDEACWTALAGDPFSHQLAEVLKDEQSCPALATHCHGTRLGLIQHYLNQARENGLSHPSDLTTYVLMTARYGEQLGKTPAWQDALAATREQPSTLTDNVQVYLRSLF